LEDDNLVEINGYKYSDPLLVDCDVKISPGKGYGLFAKHNIQKGTVLFREEDVIEKDMDKINAINWLKTLTKKECAHVLHHAYVNDDRFVWCRSVVAFINHSSIFANHELIEGNLDGDNKSGVWKTTRDVN
jgi:hypothetical protein